MPAQRPSPCVLQHSHGSQPKLHGSRVLLPCLCLRHVIHPADPLQCCSWILLLSAPLLKSCLCCSLLVPTWQLRCFCSPTAQAPTCLCCRYVNTTAVKSCISFIDGDKGILRYRGYPIEQLAEHSSFLEVGCTPKPPLFAVTGGASYTAC